MKSFGLFDLRPPQRADAGARQESGAKPRRAERWDLNALSPNEFEDLVANLYRKKGFKVDVTPRSHDAGVDVIARRWSDVGEEHLIIQCKHYRARTVGPPEVRDLIGAWQAHPKANRAVLVTSGQFSRSVLTLAEMHRIDLIDGFSLRTELRKHGLSPSS